MTREISMNQIQGGQKSFDVSMVDNGYIRFYGGMLAIGKRNKRRNELCVPIEEIKKAIAEYEAALAKIEQESENPPLTLNELGIAMRYCQPIWAVMQDDSRFFGDIYAVPCVLDNVLVAGVGLQITAIYGSQLSLSQSDYGKTWLAYRHKPTLLQEESL